MCCSMDWTEHGQWCIESNEEWQFIMKWMIWTDIHFGGEGMMKICEALKINSSITGLGMNWLCMNSLKNMISKEVDWSIICGNSDGSWKRRNKDAMECVENSFHADWTESESKCFWRTIWTNELMLFEWGKKTVLLGMME